MSIEITDLDGQTAFYNAFEAKMMIALLDKAIEAEGEEKERFIKEIQFLHDLKSVFEGSEFLE